MNKSSVYIVAVSGGVDSVVLLDRLIKHLNKEKAENKDIFYQPPTYIVAHFDHGIRGDSKLDAEFVRELSEKKGLKFELGEAKLGLEASESEAREARYKFLREIKRRYGAEKIITAHHEDDVLETMIINIIRGTGPRGLSPMNADDIIRPLINKTKKEILKYAEINRLVWREDSTNEDPKYLRNYVRINIMPKIESARQKLLEINRNVGKIYEEFDVRIVNELPKTNILNRAKFLKSDFAIQKEIIRAWLVRSGVSDIDSKTIERLTVACKTLPAGKKTDVDKGLWLLSEKQNVLLTSK